MAPMRPWAVVKRLMGLVPSVMRVDLSPRDCSSFTWEHTASRTSFEHRLSLLLTFTPPTTKTGLCSETP